MTRPKKIHPERELEALRIVRTEARDRATKLADELVVEAIKLTSDPKSHRESLTSRLVESMMGLYDAGYRCGFDQGRKGASTVPLRVSEMSKYFDAHYSEASRAKRKKELKKVVEPSV